MNDIYFWAFSGALVFLGGLITWGNERQRRAINGVNKTAVEWANRDLHIKRGQIAREIRIDDMNLWFRRVILQAQDFSPEIYKIDFWNQDDIQALIAFGENNTRYILSPYNKTQIRRMESKATPKTKASQLKTPLFDKHQSKLKCKELTILNAGVFFDLEVLKIWEQYFQKKLIVEKMYLFIQTSTNE